MSQPQSVEGGRALSSETEATETRAIQFSCKASFHRSFVLPATDSHAPLRVSYSIAGPDQSEHVPTMIWASGMFGTRYQALDLHNLAEEMGVRIVFVDRPGLGGSTPVELSVRVNVWLETVVALMSHLGVAHVALGAHSGGSTFLLNTLIHLPHILSETHPYVVVVCPWVHPDNSGVMSMNLAQKIPRSVMGHWNKLNKFVAANFIPAAGYSSGVANSILSTFEPASSERSTARIATEKDLTDAFKMPSALRKAMQSCQFKYNLAEESSGGNDEAILCLKRDEPSSWGAANHLPTYMTNLIQMLKQQQAEGNDNQKGQSKPTRVPWRVRAYFGETDMMIGKKGQEYFEQCWTRNHLEGLIDFRSSTLPGTDHETICQVQRPMYRSVMEQMKADYDEVEARPVGFTF